MATSLTLGHNDNEEQWYDKAPCRDMYPMFDSNDDGEYPHLEEAQSICGMCPVRLQCYVAGINEPQGIWGGLAK